MLLYERVAISYMHNTCRIVKGICCTGSKMTLLEMFKSTTKVFLFSSSMPKDF